MRRALAHMNAWMLDWKLFMSTLLSEHDEPAAASTNPELRRTTTVTHVDRFEHRPSRRATRDVVSVSH